jgi:hypothetical protein
LVSDIIRTIGRGENSTRLSIHFQDLTGTLEAALVAAFLPLNDVLKAAAEEKRRVRAATDFMVVEFGMASNYFEEFDFVRRGGEDAIERASSEVADNNLSPASCGGTRHFTAAES